MKNKNVILIIFIVLLIGVSLLAARLYYENVKLIQALHLSSQLIDNTSAAYKEFGECTTNPNKCNYEASKSKLEALNKEKVSIQTQLEEVIRGINLDSK